MEEMIAEYEKAKMNQNYFKMRQMQQLQNALRRMRASLIDSNT